MVSRSQWKVHLNVDAAVDRLLAGLEAGDELRTLASDGNVVIGGHDDAEADPLAAPTR